MPSLLLVHGALTDARFWAPVLDQISDDVGITAPTLYGYFPEGSLPADFSAERHVSDLEALLPRFAHPLTLVGHSRGARLAIEVARRCPDMIDRMILAEPGGVMEDGFLVHEQLQTADKAGAIALAIAKLAAGEPENAARFYVDAGHGEGCFDRLPAWLRETMTANVHTLPAMAIDRTVPLTRHGSRMIGCPTYLAFGTNSPSIFKRTIDVLSAEIPHATRIELDSCDHFFPAYPNSGFATLVSDLVNQPIF